MSATVNVFSAQAIVEDARPMKLAVAMSFKNLVICTSQYIWRNKENHSPLPYFMFNQSGFLVYRYISRAIQLPAQDWRFDFLRVKKNDRGPEVKT